MAVASVVIVLLLLLLLLMNGNCWMVRIDRSCHIVDSTLLTETRLLDSLHQLLSISIGMHIAGEQSDRGG